ncbi:MAG: indole-3-glycerol-phosphate synthase [Armatimonadota bacterium]
MRQTFSAALAAARAQGRAPLVSEIKVRSPKEGDLLRGRDPVALARTMETAGAACISVVTEPEHFGGSMELLRAVNSAVSVPVLRKDFVRCREDVLATVESGASCLLLIAALLDQTLLAELHDVARREGLETLVEVHNEDELRRVLTMELDLLGINNRDILRLERDEGTVSNTLGLIRLAPLGTRVISESAISSPEEVRAVCEAGAFGVLVGTSVLKAEDTAEAVRRLARALG